MVVVAEQAVGLDDESETGRRLLRGFRGNVAVGWVAIDGFALVPSCGDVVDGVFELDSDGSCHAGILCQDAEFVTSQGSPAKARGVNRGPPRVIMPCLRGRLQVIGLKRS